MKEKSEANRMCYLFLGAVVLLFIGVIYSWSILKKPLSNDLGWSVSQLSVNFTLTMCSFVIGGLAAGKLIKRMPVGIVVSIGALLTGGGFIASSFLESGSILLLYLFYGVMAGLGVGLVYNVIIVFTTSWFPDKRGLCSGVILMSFGSSSMLIGTVADRLMQTSSIGWRRTYLYIGIALLIVIGIAAAFVKKADPKGIPISTEKKVNTAKRDFTTVEMLHTPSLWWFFGFNIFLATIGNTTISMASELSMSAGVSNAFSTVLVGMLAVFNGVGRIVGGMLYDAKGRKTTMLTGNAASILSALCILLALYFRNPIICAVGVCFAGLSYGFSPTLTSAFISEFYGMKNYSSNYAVGNMCLIPTSLIATLSGILLSISGSFMLPYILLLALAFASLLFGLRIGEP